MNKCLSINKYTHYGEALKCNIRDDVHYLYKNERVCLY